MCTVFYCNTLEIFQIGISQQIGILMKYAKYADLQFFFFFNIRFYRNVLLLHNILYETSVKHFIFLLEVLI